MYMADENGAPQDSPPGNGAEPIKEDVKIPAKEAPEQKPSEHMIPKTRFDEVNDELKAYKEKYGAPDKPAANNETFKAPTDPLEVVKLGKALTGFNEDETDFIIRNAKTKDIEGIIKATQDEMVQLAIQTKREKVAKENKVPPPGSGGQGGLTTKTPDEIQKMTREEHIAYEKQILEQSKGQGGV